MANLSPPPLVRASEFLPPSMPSAAAAACGTAEYPPVWPPVPEGLQATHIIAIARVIERACGTNAAATYLAEAVVAFQKKAVRQRQSSPTVRQPGDYAEAV